MATILDVAREAGVGVGTVSRVLNDHPRVSPATRSRVQEVIERLDYSPNPMARGLSLGKSASITVITPGLTSSSVGLRLRGIIPTFNAADRDVMITNVDTPEQRRRALHSVVDVSHPAGLLIISIEPTQEEVARVSSAGIPLVMVDACVPGAHCFVVDNEAGERMATEHLIALGHRRIAFVGDIVQGEGVASSSPRRRGFLQAMEAASLEVPAGFVAEGPFGREAALELTNRILDRPRPPTAIVASSDTMALGVLEAAHELGMGIPDDLSVVGFDDIDVAPYLGLTTVRQPLEQSGSEGARCLLSLVDGPETEPERTYLSLELIERSTTGAPRV